MSRSTSFEPPAESAGPVLTVADRDNDIALLGETIAALAARLHAATYELLVLLREFDEQAGWNRLSLVRALAALANRN